MPTIWVRFFGCNLECNGFGQKDPKDPSSFVLPYQTIDISKIRKLEDLPVFEFGCDSSYSWSKRFDALVHKKPVEELVQDLIKLGEKNLGLSLEKSNESGFWKHPVTRQKVQLCFTGGEPMLWQKQMNAILEEFENLGIPPVQITIETNGTRPIKDLKIPNFSDLFFSISPKLYTVSGEKDAVKLDVLKKFFRESSGWLKFVVNGTKECWDELDRYMDQILPELNPDWDVWVMPVGATKEQQSNIASIANDAMQRGYKIATRNHTYVYGNVIGS
jgi:organic radical activating enzyme